MKLGAEVARYFIYCLNGVTWPVEGRIGSLRLGHKKCIPEATNVFTYVEVHDSSTLQLRLKSVVRTYNSNNPGTTWGDMLTNLGT